MANLRLGRNVFDDAVIAATSEAAGASSPWLVSHLQNPARDSSWRSSNLTSQSLYLHWSGQTRAISYVSLPRHRLHGASWRPQFYTDQAGTAQATGGDPLGGASAIAAQLSLPSGHTWGLDASDKRNADLNYYKQGLTYWLPSTLTGIKAVRITFSGTPEQFGTNLTYYEANRLIGGKHFEFARNVSQDGLERATKTLTARARSGGASNRRTAGEHYRAVTFDLTWIADNDRPALLALLDDVGIEQTLLLSFFPAAGGYLERQYTFAGTFVGDLALGFRTPYPQSKSRLVFEED